MILKGWSYENTKDEKSNVTDCLRPFVELVNHDVLCEEALCKYEDWKKVLTRN